MHIEAKSKVLLQHLRPPGRQQRVHSFLLEPDNLPQTIGVPPRGGSNLLDTERGMRFQTRSTRRVAEECMTGRSIPPREGGDDGQDSVDGVARFGVTEVGTEVLFELGESELEDVPAGDDFLH